MSNAANEHPSELEREPTAAEWAECANALRAVGIDPEHGGALATSPSPAPVLQGEARAQAELLTRIASIDRRRARVIGRPSRRRRFELREALADAGLRVESGSRWSRGLKLAMAYGELRLRESRALRIAGVLLFMHVLAMPLMALVNGYGFEPEHRSHGTNESKTTPGTVLLLEEAPIEIVAEEPIEDLDRPRSR